MAPCVLIRGGRLYPLAEGENVLGRDGDAASWFDSTSVSRRHARIVVTDGKALLEDLASDGDTELTFDLTAFARWLHGRPSYPLRRERHGAWRVGPASGQASSRAS